LLTWTSVAIGLEWLTVRFSALSKAILGEPAIIILHGKIMESTMKKNRYSLPNLLAQLRDKGVFDLTQVSYAILEENGSLSVLLKPQHQPATCEDLSLVSQPESIATKLIFGGVLLEENVKKHRLTETVISQYLSSQGIKSIRDVYLLTVDGQGTYYCDPYRDFMTGG
jgi:uncharacterized membrane protein YcaP (DUF421 family)